MIGLLVGGEGVKLGEMSISAFSRRSMLSLKALRLYDDMGLLRPNRVERGTGYRYYSESQLETARLISLLRRLDVPLATISKIAANPPDKASEMLEEWWEGIEEEVRRRRDLLGYVRGIVLDDPKVQQTANDHYVVQIREVPKSTLLYTRRHVTGPDLPAYIGESVCKLSETALQLGGVVGAHVVIFHGEVNMDSDGPVDVCVPISPGMRSNAEGAVRVEASHLQAFTRLVKRQVEFPQILQIYRAIRRWIDAQGFEISGPPREIYLGDFASAAPDDPICEIAFPVRVSKGAGDV